MSSSHSWRVRRTKEQMHSFAGSSFEKLAGLFDFCSETFLIRKGELVFARQNLIRQSFQRVLSDRIIFLGAQDQTNRRILVLLHPVFARVIEIKMHLARISVCEFADLQINDHKASQLAVKEKKIDAIPFATGVGDPQRQSRPRARAGSSQDAAKAPLRGRSPNIRLSARGIRERADRV